MSLDDQRRNTPRRAALYLRCSSEQQRLQATSIDGQRDECERYCARSGYTILDNFVDEAISGQTTERPRWRAMVEEAKSPSRRFDVVVAYDTDRFDRSRYGAEELQRLRDAGIRVEYAATPLQYDEDDELTPESEFIEDGKKASDRLFVARLARDTLRGCSVVACRGFRVGGPAPYGYRNVKSPDGQRERLTLQPDQGEAQVVAEIFRLKVEGRGNKAIRDLLNSRGVPGPRHSEWNENTIRELTRNTVYLGVLTYGKRKFRRRAGGKRRSQLRPENKWIVHRNAHEPLVTQDVFDGAQSQRQLNKPRQRAGPHRVYVLSARLICAKCGRPAMARPSKSRHGKTTAYYACASDKACGAPETPNRAVRAEEIESAALGAVFSALGDGHAVERELARFARKSRDPEVQKLERRLAEAKRKVAHLLTLAEEDLEAAERWRARKRERDQIQRDLDAMQHPVRVPTLAEAMSAVEVIRERIGSIASDPAQTNTLRSILQVLIASIKFDFSTREAEITCRIPAGPDASATRAAEMKSRIPAVPDAAFKRLRESVIAGA